MTPISDILRQARRVKAVQRYRRRELVRVAKEGSDYKVVRPCGESFLLPESAFKARYEFVSSTDETAEGLRWSTWRPVARCYAVDFHYEGRPITIKTPWGKEVKINSGDYLVSDSPDMSHCHVVLRDTFQANYEVEGA